MKGDYFRRKYDNRHRSQIGNIVVRVIATELVYVVTD
jgi:hypothetical protein